MLEMDFSELQDKLLKVCNENKLEVDIKYTKFPIVAIIKPNLEERDQLKFDFGAEEPTNFVNGEIKLMFDDELTMTVLNDFKIEDNQLNKIKGIVKKLHYVYLQLYFKRYMADKLYPERLTKEDI